MAESELFPYPYSFALPLDLAFQTETNPHDVIK